MRFWIWTFNYSASAGVRATHRLQYLLIQAGYEALIVNGYEFEKQPRRRHQQLEDDDIAIYPDVCPGNPLNAKHVVRWLMNDPKVWGLSGIFPATDLRYAFNTYHLHLSLGKRLFVNVVNPVFKNKGLKRDINALWQGKSDIPPFDKWPGVPLTIITYDRPETPGKLADLLNRVEAFYTCDESMMNLEAYLCGCKVKKLELDGTISDLEIETEDYHRIEHETVGRFLDDINEYMGYNSCPVCGRDH